MQKWDFQMCYLKKKNGVAKWYETLMKITTNWTYKLHRNIERHSKKWNRNMKLSLTYKSISKAWKFTNMITKCAVAVRVIKALYVVLKNEKIWFLRIKDFQQEHQHWIPCGIGNLHSAKSNELSILEDLRFCVFNGQKVQFSPPVFYNVPPPRDHVNSSQRKLSEFNIEELPQNSQKYLKV